jgi:hypothetical protein
MKMGLPNFDFGAFYSKFDLRNPKTGLRNLKCGVRNTGFSDFGSPAPESKTLKSGFGSLNLEFRPCHVEVPNTKKDVRKGLHGVRKAEIRVRKSQKKKRNRKIINGNDWNTAQ